MIKVLPAGQRCLWRCGALLQQHGAETFHGDGALPCAPANPTAGLPQAPFRCASLCICGSRALCPRMIRVDSVLSPEAIGLTSARRAATTNPRQASGGCEAVKAVLRQHAVLAQVAALAARHAACLSDTCPAAAARCVRCCYS